ncbi:cytochrome c4 [Pseudohongiella nitratireducens]|uniref:Cytochrome c4 n=1 Tax=Pseudohongiella nitratireducens TaxID=1768907 RepID=A0A917GX78_9GAMM|nr:c-type cytochrome [Pseudohongiella nitratireducens]MDF1624179.1 c-type cytochrome [Pseudohongiella nitratireducens]GGG59335.1 cytochrome c4 [Pseudohongiella nitratireducens]
MKRLVLSLASLVLAVSSISAQAAGDAAAGEGKSAVCAACHGADGNSELGSNPKLAGQNARYLLKQMTDIKEGNRTVALMTGLLDNMSEQDLEDIAAFYAEQEHTIQGADPELVELGSSIYRGGIADLGVAACTACHGPAGNGVAQAGFPSVSGQHAEYTATQLKAFRAGERTNDGDSAPMRTVTERLTDREIEALASYMAGLN